MSTTFETREQLVSFIEQQTQTAIEKSLPVNRIERRVPWVTSGPIGQDSVGYSVLKAAAFALGFVGADQAKEEIQTHQQLRDLYGSYGFMPHHGAQSFLVPLASAHLPAFEPQGQRLQKELHQKMTAQAGKFDPDEADWIARRLPSFRRKALGSWIDSEGGSLVGLPQLGEIIELQRCQEAFANVGAREVALPPNGRIQFPRLTAASTAYWVGEGSAITESQPSTGTLDLQAKKLGVLVKLNNELLRFASASAEGMIRLDMARAAALKADQAMLEGTGGTQIRGLLTYSGLTTHTASSASSVGDTFLPEDVALMEGKLPDAVEAPTAWLMRKQLFAAIMNRRADAGDENENGGPFLFRPNRSFGEGPPLELFGTKVVRTSQVSASRVKNSTTNLTYVLLGYFPDWSVNPLGQRKLQGKSSVHGFHRRPENAPFPRRKVRQKGVDHRCFTCSISGNIPLRSSRFLIARLPLQTAQRHFGFESRANAFPAKRCS